jgi:hypothetical protein
MATTFPAGWQAVTLPDGEEEYQPPRGLGRTYADEHLVRPVLLFNDHTIIVPRGQVVVIAGMGGTGKGFVSADFAGRNSRGENAAGEPGTSVLITPEDDQRTAVGWRLKAAGADMRRVIDFTSYGGTAFRLDPDAGDASIRALRARIDGLLKHDDELRKAGVTDPARLANPTLVMIEPLLGTVDGGRKGATISDGGFRRHIFEPLAELAAQTGVCVVLFHHMTKGGKDIAGSRAIRNAPRWVYVIEMEHGIRTITGEKTSNVAFNGSRYWIAGDSIDDTRVYWDRGPVPLGEQEPLPAWHQRALAGPLKAIAGAHLEPVEPFERMGDGARLAHLEQMHGLPPHRALAVRKAPQGYLRDLLDGLHANGHDANAVVPHRHGARMPILAITAGERRTDGDRPATAEEAARPGAAVADGSAGDGGTPEPGGKSAAAAARAAAGRGAAGADGEAAGEGVLTPDPVAPTLAELRAGVLDDAVSLPAYLARLAAERKAAAIPETEPVSRLARLLRARRRAAWERKSE